MYLYTISVVIISFCQLSAESTSIMASTSLAGWEADGQTVTVRPDVCTASDVVGPIAVICMCKES